MTITQTQRIAAPAPAPQALALDGANLWMSSWETQRLYGVHLGAMEVFEQAEPPGRLIGMTAAGDALLAVCGEEDDNRYIRRYVPGSGFDREHRVACPQHTGSFLAHDGGRLWLSQRFDQRVLELDERNEVASEIPVDAQIVGIVWVGSTLYLSTWHGKAGGCKIARTTAADRRIDYVGSLLFAGISLAHDGERFWTNDHKGNALVTFTVDD